VNRDYINFWDHYNSATYILFFYLKKNSDAKSLNKFKKNSDYIKIQIVFFPK